MGDLRFTIRVENGDDIEAGFEIDILFFDVCMGSPNEELLFFDIHKIFGVPKTSAGPGFHLHDHQLLTLPGHDIDLEATAAPVPFQHSITFALQELHGKHFSLVTYVAAVVQYNFFVFW